MYIILKSNDFNSLKQFPQNTPANFTISLPEPIRLNNEWEMCLKEIFFPHTWLTEMDLSVNIFITWTSFVDDSYQFLQERQYHMNGNTVKSVISSWNSMIPFLRVKMSKANHIEMTLKSKLVPRANKMMLDDSIGDDDGDDSRDDENATPTITHIIFSKHLSKIFGLSSTTLDNLMLNDENNFFTSPYQGSFPPYRQIFCIQCDLIESQMISSEYQQILRMISTDRKKYTHAETIPFINPFYIPLREKEFQLINIKILDIDLHPIYFASGEVILTLHLRPKQSI